MVTDASPPGKSPGDKSHLCKTQSASELLTKHFPDPVWAVPGILPEGAALLAGRPKLGKSWLAFGLGLAVAHCPSDEMEGGVALGSIPVACGPVLYLALEDGERRLQSRLRKLLKLQGGTPPSLLEVSTSWAKSSEGGLEALAQWMGCFLSRLIIIDTLARFRDPRRHGADIYQEDYDTLAQLQKLALTYQCCILVIHHTRKAQALDVLDEVSGSTGLTGAADTVLVLQRKRGGNTATLHVTGRDIENEDALTLTWDPAYCLWTLEAKAEEAGQVAPQQDAALRCLRDQSQLSPAQLAKMLNINDTNARVLLGRMVIAGKATRLTKGLYTPIRS
jgi:hypothetical protein